MCTKDCAKGIVNLSNDWLPDYLPEEYDLRGLETCISQLLSKKTSDDWREIAEEAFNDLPANAERWQVGAVLGCKSCAPTSIRVHETFKRAHATLASLGYRPPGLGPVQMFIYTAPDEDHDTTHPIRFFEHVQITLAIHQQMMYSDAIRNPAEFTEIQNQDRMNLLMEFATDCFRGAV